MEADTIEVDDAKWGMRQRTCPCRHWPVPVQAIVLSLSSELVDGEGVCQLMTQLILTQLTEKMHVRLLYKL